MQFGGTSMICIFTYLDHPVADDFAVHFVVVFEDTCRSRFGKLYKDVFDEF